MDDTQVWSAIDRRRQDVVDLVAGLSPTELATPSLCEGWTVRDVAAHLTMVLLTRRELVGLALRHPGGTNRLIRDGSITLSRRYDDEELLRRLRRLVGHHRPFPGLTCREALVDVLGHTPDMALPLGKEVHLPPDEVAEAADQVLAYAGTGKAKVFRPLPWPGLRLVADDHDWSFGTGPEVRGSMTDLFLLVTGRTARLGALRGPGAEQLGTTSAA